MTRRIALTVAVVMIGGFAMTAPVGAAAPAALSVTVTPSTGLVTGQSVQVSGSGFTPHRPLYVVQCKSKRNGKTSLACDETSLRGANPDDSGAFAIDYTVNSTLIGVLGKGLVNCTRAAGFCSISVIDPSDLSIRASAPLSFSGMDVRSRFDEAEISAVRQVGLVLGIETDDVPRVGSYALAYVLGLAGIGPITPVGGTGPSRLTTHWAPDEYAAMSAIAASHGTTIAQFQKTGALFLAYELGIA